MIEARIYVEEVNAQVNLIDPEDTSTDPEEILLQVELNSELTLEMSEADAEDLFNALNLHFAAKAQL